MYYDRDGDLVGKLELKGFPPYIFKVLGDLKLYNKIGAFYNKCKDDRDIKMFKGRITRSQWKKLQPMVGVCYFNPNNKITATFKRSDFAKFVEIVGGAE